MPNRQEWDADPVAAFATFVASSDFTKTGRRLGSATAKPLSTKSAAIYSFMFNKFARWLIAERRVFSHLNDTDLVRFVSQNRSSGEQNSLITQNYLRLLERCFQHLQIEPNPATVASKVAVENGYIAQNKGTEALAAHDIAAFVVSLPDVSTPRPGRAASRPRTWKRHRDHALQAVMLYAGLRVSEVIGLRLSEIEDPFGGRFEDGNIVLKIEPEGKHDTSYAHTTLLRSYGAAALRGWLEERKTLCVQGDLVFPGNVAGRPLGRMTVYRHVRDTFQRAGIDVQRAGGRTLRNTFAVEELRYGGSTTDLKEMLGLALERSAEIYEAIRLKRGGKS